MGTNSNEELSNLPKKKQIRKDQNTTPNEKWGEEVPYPFHTVHIDHRGPLNPMSDGKHLVWL